MSHFPLRRLVLNLRTRYHLWSGRRAYRLGRLASAGRHFREALVHGGESFEAFLLLGKIHYREADLSRAASFFARARDADGTRFLLEGFPDDFIESLRARHRSATTERPEYRIVIESSRPPRSPQPQPAMGGPSRRPAGSGRRREYGDFASRDEWLRHRDRPSIRPGEGADVDWDAEARRLLGD